MRPNGRFAFLIAFFLLSVGFLICRSSLFDPVFYSIDEAEYAVAAQGLKHGLLPGVDLYGSTKPPGIAFLYAGVFGLFGGSLLALQWTGFVFWIVLLYVTMRLAEVLLPGTPVWLAGLGFLLFANSFSLPRDMHALNVELVGTTLSLLALCQVLKRPVMWTLLIAGTLLGFAIMVRQSMVLFALAAFLLQEPRALKRSAILSVGILVPWAALLGYYAVKSDVAFALDSWIRYPFVYSFDTGIVGFFQALWLNMIEFVTAEIVPVAFAAVGLLMAVRSKQTGVLIIFVLSSIAVTLGSRFFGHYFIHLFPALAILSAIGIHALLNASIFVKRTAQVALCVGLLMALMHFPRWRHWDQAAPPRGISAESLDLYGLEIKLAEIAKEQTTPDQTIFVWGYCPQIYFHAERLPGARDFISHYFAGYSPGSTNPRPRSRPDAEELLLADFRTNRPELIFDLSFTESNPYSFLDYPITKYSQITEYVRANYEPAAMIGSVPIYSLVTDSTIEL